MYIHGNQVNQHGGGIYLIAGSTATITNSIISGNAAGSGTWEDGGGIFSAGTLDVYSSTIAGNYAGNGGVIHVAGGSATITNSILWDNTAGDGSSHQIFGSPTVTYSDVGQAGYAGSNGNINVDPDFVLSDPATAGTAKTTGDYHIQTGSPVVDQGTTIDAPTDDIEGDPRDDGSPDMGADENGETPPSTVT
jgi:hypothetical protein